MSNDEEAQTPTPADEAIQASLLTVRVLGKIQQAYTDGKIDLETHTLLYDAARQADTQVRKLAAILEEEDQAVQYAAAQAIRDMVVTPVEITYASLHKKTNVVGDDLQVQGMRWYVEVGLRNINEGSDEYDTEGTALYRVWRDPAENTFKAVRVTLI